MERIPIRITALLAMTTLAACDFLDIDTPGIVNRDKMFENEQGFIDAMNGVYASMADADLYGEQLSFGFVDEIAQLYYNDYEANETTLTKTFDLRYRDEDVRPQIDAIWSKAYNTIASANSVLDNISGHDFAILPRIRGEALTVRAFLHFDLLRLFAPNIERGDEQAIPYVEHFSISPVERSTVREVYERIVADLTEAYGLLRDAQPASGRTPEELYVSQYAAAALLAGCGSISSNDGGYYATEAAAQESYNYDSAAGAVDSSLMLANAAEAATDETAQKIIYNASLSMESTDFDAARETLMAAVEANNAWMESSSVYGTEKDHDRSADYTVRVPVDNYRALLAAAGEAGSVRNVSENAQNITSSYIDVESRLAALEAQRTRLNELADQAETTADLLEIESQLSDVQYQLENYTRQLRNMDQQVSYSTVDILSPIHI